MSLNLAYRIEHSTKYNSMLLAHQTAPNFIQVRIFVCMFAFVLRSMLVSVRHILSLVEAELKVNIETIQIKFSSERYV